MLFPGNTKESNTINEIAWLIQAPGQTIDETAIIGWWSVDNNFIQKDYPQNLLYPYYQVIVLPPYFSLDNGKLRL